jgi:hypothetical protein
MASPGETEEQRKKRLEDFHKLCDALGFAFLTWQDVEKAHFKLFLRMLGAPQWEVCSAAYYSVESFAARHSMVGRMAYFFMQGDKFKSQRKIWCGEGGGLQKEIKDANENRNKLAHYGMDFDILDHGEEQPDGSYRFQLSPPRLQPVDTNLVARLAGHTPDKPEYNLSADEIRGYATGFAALGVQLNQFQESLSLPAPQLGLGLLQMLSPPRDPLYRPPPIPKKSPPKDETSSGQ